MKTEERWLNVLHIVDIAIQTANYVNKTRLQKLVYFAQEVGQLATNYSYAIEYYGPFSRELAEDMSFLNALGYIHYQVGSSGDRQIVLTEEGRQAVERHDPEPSGLTEQARALIRGMANRQAADLGLLATIDFIRRFSREGQDRDHLIEVVSQLKSEASREQIEQAYADLEQLAPV